MLFEARWALVLDPSRVIPNKTRSFIPFWGEMDLWPQFLNRIYHRNDPDKGINSKLRGHLGKMSFPNKWKMKAELVFRATQAQAMVEEVVPLGLILDQNGRN